MAGSPMRLRRQIDSAVDLQGVVRAMKAQAAAAIAQYERSVTAVAAYADVVDQGLAAALRAAPDSGSHRPPASRAGAKQRAIVFGSDQGLVGRFNETVAAFAARSLPSPGNTVVWAVGDRMAAALEAAGLSPLATRPVPTSVQGITGLVTDLLVGVFDDRDRDVHGVSPDDAPLLLVYNRPSAGAGSAALAEPVVQRLLPLDEAWRRELIARPWPGRRVPEVIDEGPPLLRDLMREQLFVSLFRACADSLASENASRLAAMDRADSNIDKLLVGLQGRFHRLRQNVIDEQLADVTAGFRALAGKG